MRPRVLIVDDSLTVRMDLGEAFTEAGFEVVPCTTVAEARDVCVTKDFEVAVLDVVLPDGDGIELLAELKQDPETAGMHVILLSSESEVRDRIAGLERGADEYLGKPYDAAQVVRRVMTLLGDRIPMAKQPIVLIVDDSLTFCHALREPLERCGYRVVVAATGEEGLRKAAENQPDAIVVDGLLPGIDGASVVRKLRLDPALQRISCLFLTASESGADEVAALDAGADVFVRKGEGIDGIVGRLTALLRTAEGSRLVANRLPSGTRKILLVSRSAMITEWVQPVLREGGHDVMRARSLEEALTLVSLQVPDGILLEASADVNETLQACRRLRGGPSLRHVPLVVLSPPEGCDSMLQVIDAGADDWMDSQSANPQVLRARIHALLRRRDIEVRERSIQKELTDRARELEQANDQLRLYRDLMDRMPLGALVLDWEDPIDTASLRCLLVNPAIQRAFGVSEHDVVGQRLVHCFPELVDAELPERYAEVLETGEPRKLPQLRWGERSWNIQAVRLADRKLGLLAEDVTDLLKAKTERDQMERQMHAAQRLEAIGRLAGGVAHDFNNLLTVIHAYAGFVRKELREGEPARDDVDAILDAAERAARLTNQLLAFSRRQVQQLEVIDLNETLAGLDRMLQRLIGEDIDLVTKLDSGLDKVYADVTQIEQVVMNLVVNARDAMPNGGKLTLETRNVELDQAYAQRKGAAIPAGRYVMIAVTDTGGGMDEATQDRIFEPFFTTKEVGKGTGLGLATVYGVVKQSGGHVWVYSEPGRGTTFKIYLPCAEGHSVRPRSRRRALSVQGEETVLLVEDEKMVRTAAARILKGYGYAVLEAARGDDALRITEHHPGPIHLMITDMVMPEMSGPELRKRLMVIRPDMRVVYMSGYTDGAVLHQGVLQDCDRLIQKPFSPSSLLGTVREVLDGAEKA